MPVDILKFNIPEIQTNVIGTLGLAANTAVMDAIRKALIPARAYFKSIINADTRKSLRSSGATYRAVTLKVARSRKNPNLHYGILGVSRRVSEEHILDNNSKKLKIAYANRFKYSKYLRNRGKTVNIKQTTVKSRLKKIQLSKYDRARGSKSIRRIPNKYWHILEKGFIKRKNKVVPYRFVSRTLTQTRSEVESLFLQYLKRNLEIAIKKHFIKVVKNAST